MICLRCGHCCINYMVMIVDDPDKGISDDNIIAHKGEGKPCKHLEGNELGKYSCKIHNKKWYSQTPCYNHGQIEKGNTECRIGKYFIKGGVSCQNSINANVIAAGNLPRDIH